MVLYTIFLQLAQTHKELVPQEPFDFSGLNMLSVLRLVPFGEAEVQQKHIRLVIDFNILIVVYFIEVLHVGVQVEQNVIWLDIRVNIAQAVEVPQVLYLKSNKFVRAVPV